MKKWLILVMINTGLILWLFKPTYLYTQTPPPDDKKSECDMKNTEMIPYCKYKDCCKGKFLKGYICQECKKKAEKEQKDKKTVEKGKPSYMFFEKDVTFGKCPTCGAKLTPADLLNKDGNCIACDKKPIKRKACIKTVYACPNHPEKEFLKAGKCSAEITDSTGNPKKCGANFVIKYISRSSLRPCYVCQQCGSHYPRPPVKCSKCGSDSKMIKARTSCKMSQTFPHVNEQEWEKTHKDH